MPKVATIKKVLAAAYDAFLGILKANNLPEPAPTPHQQAILNAIAVHKNTHVTLDPTVSPELGCAEAVSFILKAAGVPNLPAEGFPGTSGLYTYLQNSTAFVEPSVPLPGDVIISPTGTSSKNSPHGHVGVIGTDGVYSNDSNTGLFKQNYSLTTWQEYFGNIEGFPQYYFRWVL